MTSAWLKFRLPLDRAIGIVGSIVLAPAILVLAILVRRDDGDRGLVAVPRVGQGGRVFNMWKIRSMRAEHDDGRALGIPLTASADDRITPIGARIRSLHLDELPQIFNVARGEMALLGPRPESPQFVDLSSPHWQAVLSVPPGIAGPTQIVVGDWEKFSIDKDTTGDAYSREVLPVKLAIDRWYIETAAPTKDFLIVRSLVLDALQRQCKQLVTTVAESVPEASVAIGRGHQ